MGKAGRRKRIRRSPSGTLGIPHMPITACHMPLGKADLGPRRDNFLGIGAETSRTGWGWLLHHASGHPCWWPLVVLNRRFWRSRHLERLGKTGGGRRRQRRERRNQRRSSSSSSRRRQSKRSSAQDSKLPAWRTTETARCPPEPSNALEVCSAQELP